MNILRRTTILGGLATLVLAVASPVLASGLASLEQVRVGLRIMNQVVGHTGRLIASKTYAQLPREGREFSEGVSVLRGGIEKEPAAFKAKIRPILDRAVASSASLDEASKTMDDARIAAAHAAFAGAVRAVIAEFPEDVRPVAPAPRPAG